MKVIAISLFFLVLAAALGRFGIFALACIAFGLASLYGLYFWLRRRLQNIGDLNWHGKRKEPIIITALYEGDDTIYRRQQHHLRMLEKSGNMNWVKGVENGKEIKAPVPVYAIIPGFPLDSCAGETWEEYKERAFEEERKLLRSFHAYTYNEGRHEWVMTELLNQKKAKINGKRIG